MQTNFNPTIQEGSSIEGRHESTTKRNQPWLAKGRISEIEEFELGNEKGRNPNDDSELRPDSRDVSDEADTLKLPGMDSNHEWLNQNQQCYHYTTGQSGVGKYLR